MENLVEITEIWQPLKKGEKGRTMFRFDKGQNLKMVALLANGHPLKLEEDFVINKKYITETEYKNLYK